MARRGPQEDDDGRVLAVDTAIDAAFLPLRSEDLGCRYRPPIRSSSELETFYISETPLKYLLGFAARIVRAPRRIP